MVLMNPPSFWGTHGRKRGFEGVALWDQRGSIGMMKEQTSPVRPAMSGGSDLRGQPPAMILTRRLAGAYDGALSAWPVR